MHKFYRQDIVNEEDMRKAKLHIFKYTNKGSKLNNGFVSIVFFNILTTMDNPR